MSNLTVQAIDAMSSPMLRKAVQELGGDPMKINKANPVDLKKWLKLKIAKKPAAPVAAKPVAQAPRGAAAPARIVSRPVAAAAPKPAAKPVSAATRAGLPGGTKPAAAAPRVQTVKAGAGATATVITPPAPRVAPAAANKAAEEERAWRETVELRLATLESQMGVASTTTAPVPVSNLSSLDSFLVVDEETGEQHHELDVSDVATLNEDQLVACGELLGISLKAGTAVRVMRAKVTEALQKLAGVTAEAPAEEAAPEPEAAERVEGEYQEGDVVVALFDDQEFDPCRIDKVFRKAGAITGYDVYFQADNTVSRLPPENIVGLSDTPIE